MVPASELNDAPAAEWKPPRTDWRKYRVTKSDAEWRSQLGDKKYRVLREAKTEAPASGEYNQTFPKTGYFGCAGCGLALFTASSKFKSQEGWAAFDQVVFSDEKGCHVSVNEIQGRYQIVCSDCGGHLGHVFYGEKCTAANERH